MLYISQLQLWILVCSISFFLAVALPPKTWKVIAALSLKGRQGYTEGTLCMLGVKGKCHQHRQPWCKKWMPLESGTSMVSFFHASSACLPSSGLVFIPPSPVDWFCQRSLGLLRSRQAIHRCVKHHPAVTDGWWMMGCGWCYSRHP